MNSQQVTVAKELCSALPVWSVLVEQVMLEHGYEQLLNRLIRICYQKSFTYGCVERQLQVFRVSRRQEQCAPEMQQD